MATDDEVRRLILEVIGEDKVRSLREQIDQEKDALLKLTSTLAHLTPEEIARDKGVQLATVHLAELNQELAKAGGSHRNLGMAALEASRAMEDLQYGVGGVINNIPGLVMALGGGAGLTAVISLVAVGINQLVKHAFPEWEGGVKKVKEEHEKLTEEMKKQKEALDALDKARASGQAEAERARGGAVGEVIGAHREEIRTAVGGQMRGDVEADIARLEAAEARVGAAPPTPASVNELWQIRQNLARARRRLPGIQREADVTIGRAALGGLPELSRIQGLFGPDTAIGAGLAEASPERAEQRRLDEQQVEQQRKMHRLDETIARQKEQAAEKNARMMESGMTQEEQELHRQQQADQRSAQQKRQADQREEQAKHRAASAAEQKARRNEREFIEDVRLRADQAIAGGAPAGLVGQQAAAMFERMARTNGRTTDLAQAQARMMLHLQQVQERQERQNEENQRQIQRFWDNAFRRGK